MNRERLSASAIHLRIGRLVVDADVLATGTMPGDLATRLQDALAARFAQPGATAQTSSNWLDATTSALEMQVRSALPGAET